MKVDGDAIRITFDHVGGGLMTGRKQGLEPVERIAPEFDRWELPVVRGYLAQGRFITRYIQHN